MVYKNDKISLSTQESEGNFNLEANFTELDLGSESRVITSENKYNLYYDTWKNFSKRR